jgi:outer membrane protein TolC
MVSGWKTARLLKEQSMLRYDTALADMVLQVEIAYYDVLLGEQNISVQEKAVELLKEELSDTRKRFEAGTVPRFNVLRAEVELANAQPALIRARNTFRIASNNLVNVLGVNSLQATAADVPLKLTDMLKADPYEIELGQAIRTALERRPELKALEKSEALREQDVVRARSGGKPSIQVFGGYQARNSMFTEDLNADLHGWIAGATATWDIFDGGLTRGRVREARAMLERAAVETEEAQRNVELEVRTAHSRFLEAREVLASQTKVQEQAEEAVRLATARSTAGTGTQLDVLSAQTALTQARTTQIQALHGYEVARVRLERAVGIVVQNAGVTPERK